MYKIFVAGLTLLSAWPIFADSRVSGPVNYQEMQQLFDSGTALDTDRIPDSGVLEFNAAVRASQPNQVVPPSDISPVFFYRFPASSSSNGGILIGTNESGLAPTDAARHLSGCSSIFPFARVDSRFNALAAWTSYSNYRWGSLTEQQVYNAAVTLFRKAKLAQTHQEVIVARIDTVEPGFSWLGKNYPAAQQTGWGYALGNAISPIVPNAKLVPECGALIQPFQFLPVDPPSSAGVPGSNGCHWEVACPSPSANDPLPGTNSGECQTIWVCP